MSCAYVPRSTHCASLASHRYSSSQTPSAQNRADHRGEHANNNQKCCSRHHLFSLLLVLHPYLSPVVYQWMYYFLTYRLSRTITISRHGRAGRTGISRSRRASDVIYLIIGILFSKVRRCPEDLCYLLRLHPNIEQEGCHRESH